MFAAEGAIRHCANCLYCAFENFLTNTSMTEPRVGIYGFIHLSPSFLRKRVPDLRKIASTRCFMPNRRTHISYHVARSMKCSLCCQTKSTVTIQGTIPAFCNSDNNSAKKNQPTTGYPTTLESVPTNAASPCHPTVLSVVTVTVPALQTVRSQSASDVLPSKIAGRVHRLRRSATYSF